MKAVIQLRQPFARALAGMRRTAARLLFAALSRLRARDELRTKSEQVTARVDSRIEQLRDMQWVLRENEARYRDLLDTQADIIVRRQADGRISFVNKAFCHAFGIDAEWSIGRQFEPVVIDQDPVADEGDAETSGPGERRFTNQLMTAIGPRWFAWEEFRVPAVDGRSLDVQRVGRDVTAARLAAAELAQARDQAEAANRAKSRFLAAMSHEIRTPMNGILGMASLLLDTQLSAEQLTYLRAVDQSAKTLLALIDEILDFSKIEAGKLTMQNEAFELDRCVQNAVELLSPRAHEKGLEIAWTISPMLPSSVLGDDARVRQILLNLIGNAVKFTERGGVAVSVAPGPSGTGAVRIAVRDTGPGIDAKALHTLFSEFEQFESRTGRRNDGTGLGLAISKRLARAMGGDITVETEPGRGAIFTVDLVLPAAIGAATIADKWPGTNELGSVHAALALNRLIERRALASSLREAGATVTELDGGDPNSHLETLAREGRPADLIVIDAEEQAEFAGDLLGLARSLAPGREVRGMVLLGPITRSGLKNFRNLGYDSYLVRPVRPQSLFAQIATRGRLAENMGSGEPTADARSSATPAAPRRVLLAEDNPINALLASSMLDKAGCSTHLVSDGRQAVEAVRASLEDPQERFDIILMDVHMPNMDGLEAMAAIAALARPGRVVPPVVALTANAFPEDRARCLAAGMSDYLAKPFERSELELILARWCGRDRAPGGRAAAIASVA